MANELVSIDRESTLSTAQYKALADVPPELEWLANIPNAKTRRYYKSDVAEFIAFTGLGDYAALRSVVRARVIAWRDHLEPSRHHPTPGENQNRQSNDSTGVDCERFCYFCPFRTSDPLVFGRAGSFRICGDLDA